MATPAKAANSGWCRCPMMWPAPSKPAGAGCFPGPATTQRYVAVTADDLRAAMRAALT